MPGIERYGSPRRARGRQRADPLRAPLPKAPRLAGLVRPGPSFTRGPRELQASQLGGQRAQRVYPPKPAGLFATEPEWAVYWALQYPLRLVPGVDFSFQSSLLGGRQQFGGLVLDFLLLDGTRIGISVVGLHWHYERPGQAALDQLQRVLLDTVYGIQLVFIDEDMTRPNPIPVVRDALRGVDRSRAGRG